jgi:Pyridoxamine 5'-phosphate oxidase
MTKAELDDFLVGHRICRVATVGTRGPHLTALWYVWDGTALWLTSVVRSQRWADLERDPRVAVLVEAGELERDRDGHSFSARRVVAIQEGEVIFNMSASFAAPPGRRRPRRRGSRALPAGSAAPLEPAQASVVRVAHG